MNEKIREENSYHGDNNKLNTYLAEFVYGGIDGSVTTFSVVAGATGAGFSSEIVIVLGIANLLADGVSMSVGSYLSSRADAEAYTKHKNIEYREVEECPEIEKEEIRDIYRAKGFSGVLLEEIVSVITKDKDRWVNEMMKHELEMIPEKKSPFKKALATYISFIVVGVIPLLSYIMGTFFSISFSSLFISSCILTFLAFVVIGFLKAKLNEVSIFKGITTTVLLGGAAAIISFYTGSFIERILQ